MENTMLIWGVIGILVAIVILVISGRLRVALQVGARGLLGIAAILSINWAAVALGIYFALPGLNMLTIAAVAFLGLPGLITIYGMNFFF